MSFTTTRVALVDLKEEIDLIRKEYPKLKPDSAFVLWFLRAYLADYEEDALSALTGATGDKTIDAILIDYKLKQVNVVQGKFRQYEDSNEKRSDVLAFANLSNYPWKEKRFLEAFYSKLDPLVQQKFKELVKLVHDERFVMRLYYVTTGKCSEIISNEAKEIARNAEGHAEVFIFDSKDVLMIFKDYIEGLAPAVPELLLPIASEGSIQNEGVVHRHDPEKRIESWVFTMAAKDVGEMFGKAGIRLFARNIRGYLEDTEINKAMFQTINNEPENFWYYNNGITVVCDDAEMERHEGRDVLRVKKPQVINGLQTTRTLYKASPTKGSVLVKVIKIPRDAGDDVEYDNLINSMVRATNWQNYIYPSDLVSNDHIQVFIERSLRKLGYQYIRKRQTKSEAKRHFGGARFFQIKKPELAQAVAACQLDPVIVRKGKEGLFEDPNYKKIFSSHSMKYYLSRYWLMCQVRYVAKGKPERAYAKWLVLNFAWGLLAQYIESDQGELKFRKICERWTTNKVLYPLHRALDLIFKASLKFFRLERGKGEEAKDISTFFQRAKLDQKFREFWTSSKNPYRNRVEALIEKFQKILEKTEVPE